MQTLIVRDLIALYTSLELPELADGSQKHRRRYLAAFAKQFGDYRLDELHKSDVRAWIRSVATWKTDHTRKAAVVAVNRLFRWAWEDERIPRLPFKKLTWAEGAPRRSMVDAEYRTLLRRSDAAFRRVLLFIRETGCRPQDVERLDATMIYWDAGLALLPEHKTVKITHKPKRIYLSALALRLLRFLERQALTVRVKAAGLAVQGIKVPADANRVFLNAYGKPWTSNALSMRIYRMREKCRLDKKCVLYGLRHSLGNRLRAKGIDIRTVADIYGHTSVRTTERYYLHADETTQQARAALEKVSATLSRFQE